MKQHEYTPELVKVPQAAQLMGYSDRPSFKKAYAAMGGTIIVATRKTHYVDMHDVGAALHYVRSRRRLKPGRQR